MDELLSEFLTETSESLSLLDVQLVELERNPNDPELLSDIFRLVHTIKGTCGFLGLPRLEGVAHASENVLGKIRDNELDVTPAAITLVLESIDVIKELLAVLEETESEPDGDDSELIGRLNELAHGTAAKSEPAEAVTPAGDDGAEAAGAADDAADGASEGAEGAAAAETSQSLYEVVGGMSVIDAVVDVMYRKLMADPAFTDCLVGGDLEVIKGEERSYLSNALGGPDPHPGEDRLAAFGLIKADALDDEKFDAVIRHAGAAFEELEVESSAVAGVMAIIGGCHDEVVQVADEDGAPAAAEAAAKPDAKETKKAESGGKEPSVATQSIRVHVDVLENLMTMVSELVLTRNQLLQILRAQKESEFASPLQRLNYVTSELQEGVMKTRMQPIGNAWAKLPRIVRDLSVDLGKKIELEMIGADTELDRQVLDLIKDPLTHMVRNSGDHGIEVPEQRREAGKPETGKITLNAFHEGGHILIQISDDGRGLSVEKLKDKAVNKGLATESEIEEMSDQQIQQFIFKAGFSTAEKVTNVSGRGVGMDVVRTNIEKIGGTIDLKSIEGKGSRFTIKIPLTLAIVSALIVECAGERFAIPQLSVLELVRTSAESEYKVEWVNGTPVLRLRDRLLPLISLRERLSLGPALTEPTAADDAEAQEPEQPARQDVTNEQFIVVTQVGASIMGVIVDRVFDTEEIVVKPVAPILRDIPVYSGNTILGDGSVIMILDPNGIVSDTEEHVGEDAAAQAAVGDMSSQDRLSLLIFRSGDGPPKAVPLALVARLEEFDVETLEQSDGRAVVQYRDQLMPLIPCDGNGMLRESGRQPVIVFTDRDRSMGLLVSEIVDIVEEVMDVELAAEKPGILGTAIIAGSATEVLDASYYLTTAFRDWFGSSDGSPTTDKERRLLLVDDSPFFRNLLTPLLSVAGYQVTCAESGDQALNLCESGQPFDVIVSDIEMPGMDGFELAETLRDSEQWNSTPIVALSANGSPKDIERGRNAGFDDYVAKHDCDTLLDTLTQTLTRGAA